MKCVPDWGALVAHRYGADDQSPAEWRAALEHLEGCPACRRRALAADPTLLFLRLAREPESGAELDAGETLRAVRALRRARELAEPVPERRWRWLRLAATLLLASAALLLGGVPGAPPRSEPPVIGFGHPWVPQAEIAAPPFVEAVGRPDARIYQLGQEDLSLVMIVDENLDV